MYSFQWKVVTPKIEIKIKKEMYSFQRKVVTPGPKLFKNVCHKLSCAQLRKQRNQNLVKRPCSHRISNPTMQKQICHQVSMHPSLFGHTIYMYFPMLALKTYPSLRYGFLNENFRSSLWSLLPGRGWFTGRQASREQVLIKLTRLASLFTLILNIKKGCFFFQKISTYFLDLEESIRIYKNL